MVKYILIFLILMIPATSHADVNDTFDKISGVSYMLVGGILIYDGFRGTPNGKRNSWVRGIVGTALFIYGSELFDTVETLEKGRAVPKEIRDRHVISMRF